MGTGFIGSRGTYKPIKPDISLEEFGADLVRPPYKDRDFRDTGFYLNDT